MLFGPALLLAALIDLLAGPVLLVLSVGLALSLLLLVLSVGLALPSHLALSTFWFVASLLPLPTLLSPDTVLALSALSLLVVLAPSLLGLSGLPLDPLLARPLRLLSLPSLSLPLLSLLLELLSVLLVLSEPLTLLSNALGVGLLDWCLLL